MDDHEQQDSQTPESSGTSESPESPDENILSLTGSQAVFSGRRIHLGSFRRQPEEDVVKPVPEQPGESAESEEPEEPLPGIVPYGINKDEEPEEQGDESEEQGDESDEQDDESERPFVFDFLSAAAQPRPEEDRTAAFVAGLQSVFAVETDDGTASETEEEESETDEEQELSADEIFQKEEEERNRESIDGMIRQNDADLLFELGEKYGHAGSERIEELGHVEINPTSLLEAMLFVGDRENRPLPLARAVALMRNVTEAEARESIDVLNRRYETCGAPYRIVEENGGWRFALCPEFESVRDRFFGKTRQFKLSQKIIDVLAIIAYRQPVSTAEILEIRPAASAVLAQLVKRELVSVEKKTVDKKNVYYFRTTPRFLTVFKIASLADLPIVDEVDYR